MNFKTLHIKKKGNILIIKMNRPEVMNAQNVLCIKEFSTIFENIENDNSIRAIIITGNEKSFAAGGDINEMLAMKETEAEKTAGFVQQTFNKIGDLKIPVIAAVNGYAMGGGCELAMACDFCIASENAKFALPESMLHILPGGGGTQRLPRIAGLNNALFILLTGITFNAEEAYRLGIVQKIVPSENLMKECILTAETIISKPAETIWKIKETIRKGMNTNLETGLKLEAIAFGKLVGGIGKEGMKNFLETRQKK